MRFFIDLDTLKLVTSAADNREVNQVESKRGDAAPFDITFLRSGVAESLAVDSVLTFGAKPSGSYDTDAVVLHSDFTEATSIYSGSPSFSTAALDALFSIDLLTSNDPAYVDLMAEFTWQVGAGSPTTSKTFIFRVHNDVLRGDETPPASFTAGTPQAPYAEITGDLTTDGSTVLGFSPLVYVGLSSGFPSFDDPMFALVVYSSGWKIQVDGIGDAFTSTSSATRPDEIPAGAWHATTNPHGWKPVSPVTGTPVVAVIIPAPGRVGTEYLDSAYLYKVSEAHYGIPTWRKIAHSAL